MSRRESLQSLASLSFHENNDLARTAVNTFCTIQVTQVLTSFTMHAVPASAAHDFTQAGAAAGLLVEGPLIALGGAVALAGIAATQPNGALAGDLARGCGKFAVNR